MRSGELADLAGVSLRQLQWWDEQGLIRPRHNGHVREYSTEAAELVIGLGKLRGLQMGGNRGAISLQRCRKLIRYHAAELDRIVEAIALLRRVGLTVR